MHFATSLAIILLTGLIVYYIFIKINLPGLLGLLLLGVILGPRYLNLIDHSILDISTDIREFALILILLRAGLGINRKQLKKVGKAASKLCVLPGIIEGLTVMFVSIYFLDFTYIQGGMLGFILAAVSPAIVVPSMLQFIEEKRGVKKGIPTMIISGASVDDVFAITFFSTFIGLYFGSNVNIILKIAEIPLSIIFGILIGALSGIILMYIFNKYHIRDTKKILVIISISFFIMTFEDLAENFLPIAGLIGVMTIGLIIMEKKPILSNRLSSKLSSIWVFAEILLFVLVGAEVNVQVATSQLGIGLLIIFIGLIGRSVGVLLSTTGVGLNFKEKIFCVLSYTPKATVQAATGTIPIARGVAGGEVMLAIAVIAIMFTAPLGAFAIKKSSTKLLTVDDDCEHEPNIVFEAE